MPDAGHWMLDNGYPLQVVGCREGDEECGLYRSRGAGYGLRDASPLILDFRFRIVQIVEFS